MLVSVIIPAYNQERYLAEAVRSALNQTCRDLEVIVVDDGSTDDSRNVVLRFRDPRVRYLYQENRGLSAARNAGIRASRGSFLSFLDSDDAFLPEKLDVLMAAFGASPDLGLAAGQAILIDEDGEALGEVFNRGLPEPSSEWLLGNPLHVGSVVIRREWQERAGFFDETLRSYEDWDLWLRLARMGCPMGWVARPVSLYRFHQAQMTRIGKQMTQSTFAVLDKTYREPGLGETWLARRDEAYSCAFLRAAAQAYTAGDLSEGERCIRQAAELDRTLLANDAERLARRVIGWANHVKTPEPLAFLEAVYEHPFLRPRRSRDLPEEVLQLAFAAQSRGDDVAARSLIWRAAGYQPRILLNRGVLSTLLRRSAKTPLAARVRPTHAKSLLEEE